MDYPCCPDTEKYYSGKEKVKTASFREQDREICIAVNH
jgi:hypothetical protein